MTDMNRRRLLLIGIPLLALLVGVAFWASGGERIETENAYLKSDLVPIYPEVDAQVNEVLVEENAVVQAGQAVVRLDVASLKIDLERAEARLATVGEDLLALERQYRQRGDELALADEQLRFAERELARQRELVGAKLSPATRLELAEHEVLQARGRVDILRQGIEEMRIRLGSVLQGRVSDHPLLRAASAERDAASLHLARAEIVAPLSGRVVKLPERGAMARRGAPLFTLVRADDIWVEANFKETQLDLLRPGQPVVIRLDSYPDAEWRGHVHTISPASGAEFAVLPPQNASGNWVKVVQRVPVRIAIDEGPSDLPLRAGTSASVSVDVQSGNRLSRLLGSR
ncbi:MAG: HlyD family secretion protein [Sinobacteraceae bacterium]|nr:HlyD family secretion protein [Nevskiaceae bacterium]